MTPESPKPSRVYFFGTCLIDSFYPEAGLAAIRLIEREGVRVIFPPRTDLLRAAGLQLRLSRRKPGRVARRQIRAFHDDIPIVVPSGSCAGMMKHHYPTLFAGATASRPRPSAFAARVLEWSEFMVRVLGVRLEDRGEPLKVTWHSSCHALREMRVIEDSKSPDPAACATSSWWSSNASASAADSAGPSPSSSPAISGAMVDDKVDDIAGDRRARG